MMLQKCVVISICLFVSASLGDNNICPQHWVSGGDQICLRFINEFHVTVGSANIFCGSIGASLLRFANYDYKTAFAKQADGLPVDGWWTDLNDIGQPGTWTWGGGESITPGALAWATEPTDTHHVENCVTMDTAGYLSDDDCDTRFGFLCNIPVGVGDSVGCPDGYTQAAGQCYYVSHLDDDTEKVGWEAARNACSALEPATGIFPVLANFTSLQQLQGLRQLVNTADTQGKRWVGLNDRGSEGQWSWSDGTKMADTSYLQGQWKSYPDRGTGHSCGLVHSNGQMEEADCLEKHYFVCQQHMKPENYYLQNWMGCPSPWIRGGTKCYFFNPHKISTLDNTRNFCASIKGSLLKIEDPDEKMWVEQQTVAQQMFNMWTGLQRSSQGSSTWVWDDGSTADSTLYEWNSQPSETSQVNGEHCAFVNEFGVYNSESCFTPMSFICEMDTEDVACPSTWLSDDTNDFTTCYYLSTNDTDGAATWQEAVDKCNQLAGRDDVHLVDITSTQELDYMRSLMTLQPYAGYWTDLTDNAVHGVWAFSQSYYGTPPPIPWDKEPNNRGGNENCAVMYADGKYNDVGCDSYAHILCERPVVGSSPGPAGVSTFTIAVTLVASRFLCSHFH